MGESNDRYAELSKEVLIKNKVSGADLNDFEESVDKYWDKARKEAPAVLNLYKYEYSTALARYLKNIEEEGKTTAASPTLSPVEKQKVKKKLDGDVTRQINRWNLLKTEWECSLSQSENDTEKTRSLTVDQITAQPVLINAEKRSKDLVEQWSSIKAFHDTVVEVLEAGDVATLEASKRIDFDMGSNYKRLHVVKVELERLSMVKKSERDYSSSLKIDGSLLKEKAPLKMDKIQTPKFSGKAEDFTAWKERFNSLVPKGRDSAETAVLLEQSIPENKRYLLHGCGQDWSKMFDVLQKEVAPTQDVVNSINLQLSKLKRITSEDKESDKKFVQFVEALEKMQRDLLAINRISALANC